MNAIARTCIIIASLGALNWGLIALFDFNVFAWLGNGSRIVYAILGLFGLFALLVLPPSRGPRYDFGHRQY